MAVNGVMSSGPSSAAPAANGTAGMKSEDFYKLLIAELRYQDPMQPMDNSKMVEQVAGIRNMEASTNMSTALQSVTRQQNFGTASNLIGKMITGKVSSSTGQEQTLQGVVTGVRFESNGSVILELDTGDALPLEGVVRVSDVQKPATTSNGTSGTSTSDTTSNTSGTADSSSNQNQKSQPQA